jgi:hypothetical protein
MERPVVVRRRSLRGGKIGDTRLELGIAGRKKTAFYALFTTF